MNQNAFNPQHLRRDANGMLSPTVYHAIYEAARQAPDGDIIEVGTAHGAATIALAAGEKASGRSGRVHTIEKILGGSREHYGGVNQNKEIILEILKISTYRII